MTDAQITGCLGRTVKAVSAWRRRNGVGKSDDPNFYKTWSPLELDVLRRHWHDGDPDMLKDLLPGRSLDSMQAKASDLGLKRLNKTRFTPNEVVEHVEDGTITKRNTGGSTYLFINFNNNRLPMTYHRYRWIREVGWIPDGYCLVCKSEDTTDCDPKNWELKKISDHLSEYRPQGSRAGAEAFRKYRKQHGGPPAKVLSDGFVAAAVSGFDKKMAGVIRRDHPEMIRLSRKNYTLKRKIKQSEHEQNK